MTLSPTLPDEAFLAAFLEARLAPADFNHRGHLRAAWLLLQRCPLEQAVADTCDGIARLAARLGAPDKYHRTLTEALVRLMAHGGASDPALDWEGFLAANAPLVRDARGVLAQYYQPETLASADARQRFLPPDRQPLPA